MVINRPFWFYRMSLPKFLNIFVEATYGGGSCYKNGQWGLQDKVWKGWFKQSLKSLNTIFLILKNLGVLKVKKTISKYVVKIWKKMFWKIWTFEIS